MKDICTDYCESIDCTNCPYKKATLEERQIAYEEEVNKRESLKEFDKFFDLFVDELCQIIFEGEDTEIGRKITIDRIKALACYNGWLERDNDEQY